MVIRDDFSRSPNICIDKCIDLRASTTVVIAMVARMVLPIAERQSSPWRFDSYSRYDGSLTHIRRPRGVISSTRHSATGFSELIHYGRGAVDTAHSLFHSQQLTAFRVAAQQRIVVVLSVEYKQKGTITDSPYTIWILTSCRYTEYTECCQRYIVGFYPTNLNLDTRVYNRLA